MKTVAKQLIKIIFTRVATCRDKNIVYGGNHDNLPLKEGSWGPHFCVTRCRRMWLTSSTGKNLGKILLEKPTKTNPVRTRKTLWFFQYIKQCSIHGMCACIAPNKLRRHLLQFLIFQHHTTIYTGVVHVFIPASEHGRYKRSGVMWKMKT